MTLCPGGIFVLPSSSIISSLGSGCGAHFSQHFHFLRGAVTVMFLKVSYSFAHLIELHAFIS